MDVTSMVKRVASLASERVLYFAYGYNMFAEALRQTAPTAMEIGIGWLEAYSFTFYGAPDGSTTWATIERRVDTSVAAPVWGVLYALTEDELRALDMQEEGYARREVEVTTLDGLRVTAQTYVATSQSGLANPPAWYVLNILHDGARRGFPREYLLGIETAAGGSAGVLGSRTASTGYFKPGDEVLFGKYKNKRGKILRFFVDERGVPMMEIEPIPKGRKKNRLMGLYNVWHLPERRFPKKEATKLAERWLARTACIVAGKRFGNDLCLFKNRDRAYDAKLQVLHMEFNGVEMAFVLDLETGFLEGVNEHGIGIVNTTLTVVRDENEGPGKKKTVKSKDGPKIFMALMQPTLDEAVASLVAFDGGLRGHTLVADGRRLIGIEQFGSSPAHISELDVEAVNARTNDGLSVPGTGYAHGEDYVSSVVRRCETDRRLRDVVDPLEVAPAVTRLIDEPKSPFNPVRITDNMRTTSQLVVDTTNPALILYLIPGHAELAPSLNLLPAGREPKIPVQVFRYKRKMEDRDAPWLKKADREVLDLSKIDKLREDFLTLMKNVSVVKDYDQADRWKRAVTLWRERYNDYLYKFLRKEIGDLGFQGTVMTSSDAKFWQAKIGKETWGLYAEFRVPLDSFEHEKSIGRNVTPEYLFEKMQRELPKWEARVRRASRQAWAALKSFVTWFEQRAGAKMTVEVPTDERVNLEGFQVIVRGFSPERFKPEEAIEGFKAALRMYKQRARAVLPLLLQHQLPLILDFNKGLDDGATYHGTYIEVNAQAFEENVGAMVHILAHEMAHHIYKHYLSGDARKFWDAAITGNYGKLDLHDVLRRYGDGGPFFNEQMRKEDPLLYLQIHGLLHGMETKHTFEQILSTRALKEYLDGGGQAEFIVHGKPITGYAHKNHEEAFCEAVGMLVGYGPQAVLPEVREWLKTILPSLKVAMDVVAKGRYKSKKTVKTKDGDDMVVYEYGPRQVANRNREKAERVENLRKQITKLRAKVKRDLASSDEQERAVALAVALMDETYERVGNDASAKDGHFGVTTWQVKHVKFKGKKATFSYVGKSGVDHVKEVDDAAIVKALRAACDGKSKSDCVIDVGATEVNEYLKPFDITAKDLRGFHANREMKERLKAIRSKGPKLPEDRKERDELLKEEFKEALAETAEAVGHTESTLRSQYLVPGLEDDFMKDGTVKAEHTKKALGTKLRPLGESTMGGGQVLTMPLKDDKFVHFTPSSRALEILRTKKLLMHPPHQKFGIDAVSAVSTTYGQYVPGVQTTHIKGDGDLVAILFSTNTPPDRGYVEEVTWKQDVHLVNPKLLSAVQAAAMLRVSPAKISDQDMVLYDRAPSKLKTAAMNGTPIERRMLAAASHAMLLVAHDRQWWITFAPNVYRIARDDERPRPSIEGLSFPTGMFATLWYEDADGNRVGEFYPGDYAEPGDGTHTQHSQFPNELRHGILVLNEDGTSSSLGAGMSSWSSDLVTAMVRSGDWDVADAIMVAGQSCERCGNVLRHHYGLDGYPFASEKYWQAGTCCEMCRDLVGDPHLKSATPKYEEYVRRKEQLGEHPLKRDEWEAKVLGVSDEKPSSGPPSKDTWESFRKDVLSKHSLEKLWTTYRPEERMLSVDNIGVAKDQRGKGNAGRAMRDVVSWADTHGITITLSPTSDFGSSKKRLEKWYRSLGFVPNSGRSKDFRTRDSMIRSPKPTKQATKTPAEREDENVQKMLRKEPKKKPPRYDLRDNRTLSEDDPDLEGTGGGDDGDRDLSLKWNRVGQRVAFRWLALARHPSAARVALARLAKEGDKSEFEREVSGKRFRHPDTGNEVEFSSLPTEEQKRIYERWSRSREDDAEDLTDDVKEEDDDAEDLSDEVEDDEDIDDLSDEAEDDEADAEKDEDESGSDDEDEGDDAEEGGQPYSNAGPQAPESDESGEGEKGSEGDESGEGEKGSDGDESDEAPEEAEGKPRTKDDVARELDDARDRIEDLDAHVLRIKKEMQEGRENIKALLKLVEKASDQNKANIEQKVKEEKKKLRDLDDELDEKQSQLKDQQKLVKSLKEERRAPEAPQPEKPSGKGPSGDEPPREESGENASEYAEQALADARKTMESLVGGDSDIARDFQRQVEKVLKNYDDQQIQKFSESLRDHLRKLVSTDPNSREAIDLANRAAKLDDLGGETDPAEVAERLAGMAYARNVVANPMNLGGEPIGGHEMDDARYGERAQQAFEHYRNLHKTLRRHAAEQIASELRDLEPDSNKAQELNAILTGMNAAHVADTGEALPGRPQPSAGHTALVRKLVETGNASHMFKPLEDFFADDSRRAMSESLREMSAEDIGSFILGEDGDHPFSGLKETLEAPGISEYKQMVKDFLIQDFLNDTWGDRAVRDIMQAAGAEGAADPVARAKILAQAKKDAAGPVHAALAAMERVSEARSRGEDPDPADEEIVRQSFEGDDAAVLRHNVRSLLETLRSKFKKHVVSPALAVLDHFVKNKDPEPLGQETVPHPDEGAEEPEPSAKDEHHEPGDVWRTPDNNWRAKNDEGTPKTFSDRQEAEEFAGRSDDWSAEFDDDVSTEERGPSKFASALAETWLRRVRSVHPDDPRRPIFEQAA